MTPTPLALATKDNAVGTLLSNINASALSVVLATGLGSLFPQPYNGAATSGGTATTLNCTGISALIGGSAAVGKAIYNATDGSIAWITAVATNSLTTTALIGGTSNTWGNAQTWYIDPFVLTTSSVSSGATSTATGSTYEEMLVIGRSTDTMSIATACRGYNGTTATSFQTGDYAYLNVTSPIVERLKDILSAMAVVQSTHTTALSAISSDSEFYAVATGSANAFAASFPSVSGPQAAGMRFFIQANFSITGSSTVALTLAGSAQSALTLKKRTSSGLANLASGDILNGDEFEIMLDGTYAQILTPISNGSPSTNYDKEDYISVATSSDISTGDTSEHVYDTQSYTIPANWLATGQGLEVTVCGTWDVSSSTSSPTLTFRVKIGSTALLGFVSLPSTATFSGQPFIAQVTIMGTAAAGASATVFACGQWSTNPTTALRTVDTENGSGTFATNGSLTLQFSGQTSTSIVRSRLLFLKVRKVTTTAQ